MDDREPPRANKGGAVSPQQAEAEGKSVALGKHSARFPARGHANPICTPQANGNVLGPRIGGWAARSCDRRQRAETTPDPIP